MIYFSSRLLARQFASKAGKSVKDLGKTSAKRWAVIVVKR